MEQKIDFFEVVKKRRSVRCFIEGKIPRKDLKKIIDTGRLAPCGGNKQAWHFIVVTDQKLITKILILLELSKTLFYLKTVKKIYNPVGSIGFLNASAVIAVAFDREWSFYKEDGSAAIENMLLSASALGYGGCWVHGQMLPYVKEIEKMLNLPSTIRLFSMIVIGKIKNLTQGPSKKKLKEILYWDKFSKKL